MTSNDKHTIEEASNHQEDMMEMIKEMRKELETLKRRAWRSIP